MVNYSHPIGNLYIPKDLRFILEFDENSNWNLFNSRMVYIKARILGLLEHIGDTMVAVELIEDFNAKYK